MKNEKEEITYIKKLLRNKRSKKIKVDSSKARLNGGINISELGE